MDLLGDLAATVIGYEARTGLVPVCSVGPIGPIGAADSPGAGLTTPLCRPGASFVTLTLDGEPAGCRGSLRRRHPLWLDVAMNARRAAFDDRRYAPVSRDQLARLTVRVSVLSSLEEVPAPSVEGLAAALRPGVDGLLLSAGDGEGAVFLPHVWPRHPAPPDYIAALVRKAGWGRSWRPATRAWRYTTQDRIRSGPKACAAVAPLSPR